MLNHMGGWRSGVIAEDDICRLDVSAAVAAAAAASLLLRDQSWHHDCMIVACYS